VYFNTAPEIHIHSAVRSADETVACYTATPSKPLTNEDKIHKYEISSLPYVVAWITQQKNPFLISQVTNGLHHARIHRNVKSISVKAYVLNKRKKIVLKLIIICEISGSHDVEYED
jgi:hypothetical protein